MSHNLWFIWRTYAFLDPVSVTESKELCENINEAISQKKQNFAIVYVSKESSLPWDVIVLAVLVLESLRSHPSSLVCRVSQHEYQKQDENFRNEDKDENIEFRHPGRQGR